MKKELDELITVLDDAVDMQDNSKYHDALDNAYQDGILHDLRRHLNKQTKRVQELEAQNQGLHIMYDVRLAKFDKVESQNKRYREAREKIDQLYKENYVRNAYGYEDGYLDGLDTAISIIDKALEGEE